jgi:hypothetical protein
VLATLSATRTGDLKAAGEPTASALTSGYHLAFFIGAALVLASVAIALLVLEPERRLAPAEGHDAHERQLARAEPCREAA